MNGDVDRDIVKKLIERAIEARNSAYAPYSGFYVGAAALGSNGMIYTGCNIENVSFSATNCAERTAIFKGVSEGCTEFDYIAVAGARKGEELDYCFPCGVCRQVMLEFCGKKGLHIIVAKDVADYKVFTLEELMPGAFAEF